LHSPWRSRPILTAPDSRIPGAGSVCPCRGTSYLGSSAHALVMKFVSSRPRIPSQSQSERRFRMPSVSKPNPVRLLLAAGLAAALVVLTVAPASAAHPIPIAAARALPLGTVVTVEGSVTVPSGVFASSFFDEGFAIQDLTGGIYVSMADNLGLRFRQEARVTGTLTDSGGLLV